MSSRFDGGGWLGEASRAERAIKLMTSKVHSIRTSMRIFQVNFRFLFIQGFCKCMMHIMYYLIHLFKPIYFDWLLHIHWLPHFHIGLHRLADAYPLVAAYPLAATYFLAAAYALAATCPLAAM